jgi:hypothetical protein
MLNRFKSLPFKSRIMLAMTGALILCSIPVIGLTLLLRQNNTAQPTDPIQFEYCGSTPTELCVLSFGRDGAGNALINFFVPNKKFPGFYLIVRKAGLEYRYVCQASSEIKTSVFCMGEPLSLKQTIQMDLFAQEDDGLLASGSFFIEAFLVSAQNFQSTPGTEDSTLEPLSLEQGIPAATNAADSKISPTLTPTIPPSSSSYPYP